MTNIADLLAALESSGAAKPKTPLDLDTLSELIAPGGPLAAKLGDKYEQRSGQEEMLRFVAERFNEGGVGLVEGGTGIGKSLAYLLPAIRWAVQNGGRTIVSTKTINLQQQLVEKDLGIVKNVLSEEFKGAIFKGRGQYISIRRAKLALKSATNLFPDDRSRELQELVDWADSTEDGSRNDLATAPAQEIWAEVVSNKDVCLKERCEFFDKCHYQRAKRKAGTADVLIVNHALFFSDLNARINVDNFHDGVVIPPYKHVIFDEAHHVVDEATTRLGKSASLFDMYRVLNRLDRDGKKGVLTSIEADLRKRGPSTPNKSLLKHIEERVRQQVRGTHFALGEFSRAIMPWVVQRLQKGANTLHLEGEDEEPLADSAIKGTLEATLLKFADLKHELKKLVDLITEDSSLAYKLEGRLLDLDACRNQLDRAESALRHCVQPEDTTQKMVRWLERKKTKKGVNLVFQAFPLDVAPILAEHLFGRVKTAILASATMAFKRDFAFIRKELGLSRENPNVKEEIFDSPFNYSEQSRLLVPVDLEADWKGIASHDATADVIMATARITNGGLLALFTSYHALRQVAFALRQRGMPGSYKLLVQGEGGRSKLLHDFIDSGSAVLLATASFWEGVDIPGSPLRALVIHKLPFPVPTTPLFKARSDAVSERGGNPFMELSVPRAALLLKQGVGRLIRTRQDRGVILLLDKRIKTKRYGRYIVQTLPEIPGGAVPWPVAKRSVSEFYSG